MNATLEHFDARWEPVLQARKGALMGSKIGIMLLSSCIFSPRWLRFAKIIKRGNRRVGKGVGSAVPQTKVCRAPCPTRSCAVANYDGVGTAHESLSLVLKAAPAPIAR
jgi:hypothetical protein